MGKINFSIPIRTVSESNSSEHWSQKSRRHKQQQLFVRLSFEEFVDQVSFPCRITMTRLAPRMLDDDNLSSAFKYIRDEISECILPEKRGEYIAHNGKVVSLKGRADSDERLEWVYKQRKNGSYGIVVELEF